MVFFLHPCSGRPEILQLDMKIGQSNEVSSNMERVISTKEDDHKIIVGRQSLSSKAKKTSKTI